MKRLEFESIAVRRDVVVFEWREESLVDSVRAPRSNASSRDRTGHRLHDAFLLNLEGAGTHSGLDVRVNTYQSAKTFLL